MKATLSYPYIGEKYPELSGTVVVVKDIAEKADIPYVLLKNRMSMKNKRTNSLRSVWISDSDLEPKKRVYKSKRVSKEDEIQQHNNQWLKRPLV